MGVLACRACKSCDRTEKTGWRWWSVGIGVIAGDVKAVRRTQNYLEHVLSRPGYWVVFLEL